MFGTSDAMFLLIGGGSPSPDSRSCLLDRQTLKCRNKLKAEGLGEFTWDLDSSASQH